MVLIQIVQIIREIMWDVVIMQEFAATEPVKRIIIIVQIVLAV